MKETDFEGTLVLEKLAEAGLVDDFFEAVDSDDFRQAEQLMKRSGLDRDTIATVLNRMSETDGEP